MKRGLLLIAMSFSLGLFSCNEKSENGSSYYEEGESSEFNTEGTEEERGGGFSEAEDTVIGDETHNTNNQPNFRSDSIM